MKVRTKNFNLKIVHFVMIACLSIVVILLVGESVYALEWTTESVRSAPSVGEFSPTSIAVNSSSMPSIAYYNGNYQTLEYAHYDGSDWTIQTVDTTGGTFCSLALDDNGYPHISYSGYSGGSYYYLKYAHYNGSSWSVQTIDTGKNTGRYSSIAIDSLGHPHISYFDGWNQDLKYAYHNGSSWSVAAVDGASENVGTCTSITVDDSNHPHIGYAQLASSGGNLKYATNDGSSWSTAVVNYSTYVSNNSSIALDANGNPCIAFGDVSGSSKLKYASNNGSSWIVETVDSAAYGGCSLLFDDMGTPHISYRDYTNELAYATYDGSAWSLETVSSGNVVSPTSLALSEDGMLHVAYYDSTTLKHASAETQTVPEPSTLVLTIVGVLFLGVLKWRNRKR
ncbi:MAG: PEP-CTERM sorting domain-containing protein [Planctomycetia bacterium]|jgi:hypothetical protein